MTRPVGRLLSVVFDCADPEAESTFWAAVLGYVRHQSEPDWVSIVDTNDGSRKLSFDQVADYVAPTWPDNERPKQAHIDVLVADLPTADARVRALGARRLTEAPVVHDDESFQVYADPAGHPFCLIVQKSPDK